MRRALLFPCFVAIAGLFAGSAFAAMENGPADIVGQMGLKPGQWRTTIRIVDATAVSVSGEPVSPDVQDALQSRVGWSTETEDCIGWDRPPGRDLILPGISVGAACTLSGVEADGRRLRIESVCGARDEGFEAKMNLRATHSDVAMTADVDANVFSGGTGLVTKISMVTTSSHVGQCRAG